MFTRSLSILAAVFLLCWNPLAAQELPVGYDDWVVALNQECGELKIELRRTVTLDGESEALAMWWKGDLINSSVAIDGDDGESTSTSGMYNGEWTTIEAVDEKTEKRAERLIDASVIQAGGEDALEAYRTCQGKIQQQVMLELTEGIREMGDQLKSFGDAMKEGLR
ncbi:hypothetical protein KC906_03860 [Candidatus Kaiserbacteria bacterium]|nr:hypothetical protein [Candidatus Kaiserbacteria bacterium]MCB9812429.1 hypothetical protein [Candidatus Nomurabacteria bacterium]